MAVTEKWTCPRCLATWERSKYQDRQEWETALRNVQAAHGVRCERRNSVQ